MAYEVLARKWRPQQFDDVVGQEHVTRTLTNAINNERVAHAYLFVGPRGIGKTTTARILAKALNCEKGPTATPCDQCDACKEIMGGRNLDVLEIDGASNNGVDQVRDLRDNARYAPSHCKFKVYIIDEVHMLSIAAFNALLKTLEEPPPHVKFIFATTEPQKVPATILSRCQRFDLRPISTKKIVAHLGKIARAEGIDIDDDALLAIGRAAEGGLRDAESALDQLIAFQGKTIREEDVMSVFGLMARQTLEDMVEAVLAGNIPKAIQMVDDLDHSGKDMQRVIVELLDYFRNLLIVLYAAEKAEQLDMGSGQGEALKRQAAMTDPARVLRIIEILTTTDQRLRYALSKRTLLEVAIIRSSRAAVVTSLDEIISEINQLKQSLASCTVSASAGAQKKSGTRYIEKPTVPKATQKPKVSEPAPAARATSSLPMPATSPHDVQLLADKWHEIVERVGHTAQLARGYLLDAKPVSLEGDTLTIGFDPEFQAEKEKIDHSRNVSALQAVVRDLLGRSVKIEFVVLDARETLPGDIKLQVSDETQAGTPPAVTKRKRSMSMKARQRWQKNDTVRKTLEMFDGDIVDIRE